MAQPAKRAHPNSAVFGLCLNRDDTLCATGANDGTAIIWRLPERVCVHVPPSHSATAVKAVAVLRHDDEVKCVLFLHDGRLASATTAGSVHVWLASGAPAAVLKGHTDRVYALALHPCDAVLASGSDDRTIRIWDTDTLQCRRVIDCGAIVESLVFVFDDVLAAGLGEARVAAFDCHTGARVMQYSHNTSEYVYGLAVSPLDMHAEGRFALRRLSLTPHSARVPFESVIE